MARTRSISSIEVEIKKLEEELKKDPNLSPAVEYLTDPHLNAKGYFCVMDRELRGV